MPVDMTPTALFATSSSSLIGVQGFLESSSRSTDAGCSSSPASSSPCCQQQQLQQTFSQHRRVVHHQVPHCKQHFSWDCGLACVLMVVRTIGIDNCDHEGLRQLCPITSVWTVDIAHLLRQFGLDVQFFTVTLGPNPAFANETFYMETMEEDERRVSQLFHEASAAGIAIQQRSLAAHELQAFLLSGACLVIVLVDKRKLDPWLMAADMCLPALCGIELGYTGHYILIIGFDSETQQFVIRDPASSIADLKLSAAALDQARRSFGTDEDVLVISSAKLAADWARSVAAEHSPAETGVAPAGLGMAEAGEGACPTGAGAGKGRAPAQGTAVGTAMLAPALMEASAAAIASWGY